MQYGWCRFIKKCACGRWYSADKEKFYPMKFFPGGQDVPSAGYRAVKSYGRTADIHTASRAAPITEYAIVPSIVVAPAGCFTARLCRCIGKTAVWISARFFPKALCRDGVLYYLFLCFFALAEYGDVYISFRVGFDIGQQRVERR